ncbi:unnamed protein product, partial [Closterium sp. NIES-54]
MQTNTHAQGQQAECKQWGCTNIPVAFLFPSPPNYPPVPLPVISPSSPLPRSPPPSYQATMQELLSEATILTFLRPYPISLLPPPPLSPPPPPISYQATMPRSASSLPYYLLSPFPFPPPTLHHSATRRSCRSCLGRRTCLARPRSASSRRCTPTRRGRASSTAPLSPPPSPHHTPLHPISYQVTMQELFGRENLFGEATIRIFAALHANLERKSKLYRDPALTQLFLMNNVHYIVHAVR